MRRRSALLVNLIVAMSALAPAAIAAPSVQIKIGGDGEAAACDERAVLNEREASEGRVVVRSGPAASFRPLDRLPVGTEVYLCDRTGTFLGIIYGDGDCGLAEPIERRSGYRGRCESGWVHNRSVDREAGGES